MQQLTPHLYQLSLGFVNAFLLEDDDHSLTLVDTGMKGSADKLLGQLQQAGKNPADIKRIILTHAHSDHAGNAAELQHRLRVPVWAHAAEAALLEKGLAYEKPLHLTPGLLNWLVYHLAIKPAGNTVPPLSVDRRLLDGELLPIAGGLRVIATPGHSAGHLSLLLQPDNVLIAMDICAHAASLALSTVYEDKTLGLQSILKAASYQPAIAVFGHGKPLLNNAGGQLYKKFAPLANRSSYATG